VLREELHHDHHHDHHDTSQVPVVFEAVCCAATREGGIG
jgi:hypothetical protein